MDNTLVSKIELFKTLDEKQISEIVKMGTVNFYEIDSTIFEEGDDGDTMYVVIDGSVKISIQSGNGNVVLSRMEKGSFFGEMAVIDRKLRTAKAETSSPTTLFELKREPFLKFVESNPSLAIHLLQIMSTRLRETNRLFSETGKIHYGLTGETDHAVEPYFDVTLVGYGRYGNLHIGPKYAKRGYLWNVKSVVDPMVTEDLYHESPLGISNPDAGIFKSFEEWKENYLDRISKEKKPIQAIEVSLRPDILYEAIIPYIESGIKNFILPKPVVKNRDELNGLIDLANKFKVKMAVSSQWYYSDFPLILRREIMKYLKIDDISKANIYKIEMDFSKENGTSIYHDPVLCEMPHVIQLIDSVGLADLSNSKMDVKGNQTFVEVNYYPDNVERGIKLICDLDYYPSPRLKKVYPDWDVQERRLSIYMTAASAEPEIEVDFWIKFDRSGDVAVRSGMYIIREKNCVRKEKLELNFVDDQLLNMNCIIYNSFKQNFEDFQRDLNVLSLERYKEMGTELMKIQEQWAATL